MHCMWAWSCTHWSLWTREYRTLKVRVFKCWCGDCNVCSKQSSAVNSRTVSYWWWRSTAVCCHWIVSGLTAFFLSALEIPMFISSWRRVAKLYYVCCMCQETAVTYLFKPLALLFSYWTRLTDYLLYCWSCIMLQMLVTWVDVWYMLAVIWYLV